VTIGDCGLKNGGNLLDNGYIILKQCRIPKENLLGRFGRVDSNGKY
jgi:acyl-CoA oxidase